MQELNSQSSIVFTVKLTQGINKGAKVKIYIPVDEIAEETVSSKLIEEGWYDSMGHPFEYYDVLKIETDQRAYGKP